MKKILKVSRFFLFHTAILFWDLLPTAIASGADPFGPVQDVFRAFQVFWSQENYKKGGRGPFGFLIFEKWAFF